MFIEPESYLESQPARLIVVNQMPCFFNDDQLLRIKGTLQFLGCFDWYPGIISPLNDIRWYKTADTSILLFKDTSVPIMSLYHFLQESLRSLRTIRKPWGA